MKDEGKAAAELCLAGTVDWIHELEIILPASLSDPAHQQPRIRPPFPSFLYHSLLDIRYSILTAKELYGGSNDCTVRLSGGLAQPAISISLPDLPRVDFKSRQPAATYAIGIDADQMIQVKDFA